jgi:hypothetical protein
VRQEPALDPWCPCPYSVSQMRAMAGVRSEQLDLTFSFSLLRLHPTILEVTTRGLRHAPLAGKQVPASRRREEGKTRGVGWEVGVGRGRGSPGECVRQCVVTVFACNWGWGLGMPLRSVLHYYTTPSREGGGGLCDPCRIWGRGKVMQMRSRLELGCCLGFEVRTCVRSPPPSSPKF